MRAIHWLLVAGIVLCPAAAMAQTADPFALTADDAAAILAGADGRGDYRE